MKPLERLTTIQNVVAGGDINIPLPVGNVYEKVHLYYTNMTAADIKDIEVRLNDKIVSEYADGAQLELIDKHYSRPQLAGVLTLNFTRTELRTTQQSRFFGLDTSKSQGVTIASIQCKLASGLTDPTLVAVAEKSFAIQGAPNYLTKVRRFFKDVSAAGTVEIDNLPRPVGASIAAIHLIKGDITKASLIVDSTDYHNVSKIEAADMQKVYGRTPQTDDATVIDMVLDGDITEAFPITANIQDMRLRLDVATSGQVQVLVEYIDQWGVGRF